MSSYVGVIEKLCVPLLGMIRESHEYDMLQPERRITSPTESDRTACHTIRGTVEKKH